MSEIEQRVETLEVKVAFQEHLLGDLDEVIRALRLELEQLSAQVLQLTEDASREAMGDQPGERPPHY